MTVSWPGTRAQALVSALAGTQRLLVALDFDGTLSPLVDVPMDARATPAARAAVADLAALPDTTVALVSGRSMRDLREIAEHADDSPVLLAGSHGVEYWVPGDGLLAVEDDEEAHDLRERLRTQAEELVADLAGVWIEDKTYGFALPTRMAAAHDAGAAQERIDALVTAQAPHWRRRTGHDIVEYAFRQEGKDTGLARLRERVQPTAVLFAGDDVTDEDALRTLQPGDVGVRIGTADTAANVRVADIDGIVDLLGTLAAQRRDLFAR